MQDRPLTQAEIDVLPEGTLVKILWAHQVRERNMGMVVAAMTYQIKIRPDIPHKRVEHMPDFHPLFRCFPTAYLFKDPMDNFGDGPGQHRCWLVRPDGR